MSNPAGTPAPDQPPAGGMEGASDDDMNVARSATRDVAGGGPTDDDMSVAREPESEAPQPPDGMASSPPGQGLDVDRGALPAGGAAQTETSGRESAGAFNDFPGPQGALGAMPGSDMAQEPGGTGYTGDFEPVDLPDA